LNVAAIQFRGDRRARAERLSTLCERIRSVPSSTDLVVCPELAVTGYVFTSPEEASKVAEAVDGATTRALGAAARDAGAWVVCGFVERDRDRLFNSAAVIDPSGALRFTYRKTLLYEVDEAWAEPGDSGYARFDTDNGDFGVGICMDLNDPRFVTWLEQAGPTALAFPTNWVEEGEPVWPYWAGRLSTARSALVAANTWGQEAHVRFSGCSAILQARAETWFVLAAADREGDAVITARLQGAAG
jgi:predicted amidohydrolase